MLCPMLAVIARLIRELYSMSFMQFLSTILSIKRQKMPQKIRIILVQTYTAGAGVVQPKA